MFRALLARGVFYWLRAPKNPIDLSQEEWILAIVRVLLGACCLAAVIWGGINVLPHVGLAFAFLYFVCGLVLFVIIRIYPDLSPASRIGIHLFDILWAAHLTALIDWPGMSHVLFSFVAISSLLRWGFWEAQLTNAFYILVLLSDCVIYNLNWRTMWTDEKEYITIADVLLYVVISIVIGLLSEAKAVYSENYSIARMVEKLRLEPGLERALRTTCAEALRISGATQLIAAIRENRTGRTFLFRVSGSPAVVYSSELDASGLQQYFFPAPAASWRLASVRNSELPQFRCTALERGELKRDQAACRVPEAFLSAHPFHALLAVSPTIGADWAARVYVIDPVFPMNGAAALRYMDRVVRQVAPVVRDLFLAGRLKQRTKAAVQSRVAHELHDGVIQALASVNLQVEEIRRQAAAAFANGDDPLARIQKSISSEISSLREFTQHLRLLEVNSSRLLGFLNGLAVKFQCEHGISTSFVSEIAQVHLRANVCSELARIAQEALVNVRKHSNATEVFLRFSRRNGQGIFTIIDNGRGFPFSGQYSHEELQSSGKGPVTIMERAAAINGTVSIESVQGKGTRLEVIFPYQEELQAG